MTGSSRGLGKEIALALARAGAKVALNYANDRAAADQALDEAREITSDSCLVQADVTDADQVERLVAEVNQQLGPIDILVFNATCPQPELSIEQYDWPFHQRMLDFFVKSPVLLTKACLAHMKERKWGRLVHVTSEVFALGKAPFSAYVAAKGGQTGLARSTARELAPFGITVNMVAPGWIPVERHSDYPQSAKDAYVASVPARRFGSPVDVAHAVVYFASDQAAFVTGQTLSVNGGNTVF